MKNKTIIIILIASCIAIISVACIYAADATKNLKEDPTGNIEVKDGKLIFAPFNEDIGTVKQIKSTYDGEKEIFSHDANAIKKVIVAKSLLTEYIVEDATDSSNSGIYWIFEHEGNIFLAFNPAEKTGNSVISKMTDFCRAQGA